MCGIEVVGSRGVLRPFRAGEERGFIIIPQSGMIIYIALSGLFRYYYLQLYYIRALKGLTILTKVIGLRYVTRTLLALKGRNSLTMGVIHRD